MTVAAMGGEWGIAPQAAKLGAGTFTPGDYTWRRFRAPQLDLGTIQFQSPFPQEVSGFLTPTGFYKGGAFYGGSVDMLPRTESVMGFFYYALMGNVSSVTGVDMDGVASTNVNTHIFNYNALNTIPWFATRFKVPGQTGADTMAHYGIDCHVNAAQFRMVAAGKLMSRIGIVGRRPQYEGNPTFVWNNALEDDTTVPEACTGVVSIGSESPTVVSAQIDVINTLSSPQAEMIFGSYHPDDFIPLSRSINIRVRTKWANQQLLLKTLTGLPNGTAWDPNPYITYAMGPGNNYGFLLKSEAPKTIAGSSPSRRYMWAIRGNRAVWLPVGNTILTAGDMVMQDFMATITTPLDPTTEQYGQIVLQNAITSYAWT